MISHLFVKFEQKYRLRNTSAANYANLYTNAAETKDDHLELHTTKREIRDWVISDHSKEAKAVRCWL